MYLLPNLFALLSLVLPFLMTFDSSLRGCMLRIPEVSYCIGDSISMVPKLYSLIRSCTVIAYGNVSFGLVDYKILDQTVYR